MAWRLQDHVICGEVDNRTRGHVTGQIWLAGVGEPMVLDLLGDCHPDLAGCLLRFENPQPIAMTTKPPTSRQRGKAGEITAAQKVRVFDVPFEEAYAMIKAGGAPPEHLANSFYLEWYSPLSGRCVIQSTEYKLTVSEPAWHFSMEELLERKHAAAEQSSDALSIEIRNGGQEEKWDEFRCEQLLRESDARGEKYRRLLEKYLDHPDRDRIIAHEMGWTWLEEALDKKAKRGDAETDTDDFLPETQLPGPDLSREGIDWVRDEDGEIAHPIKKKATEVLYALLEELSAVGNPEGRHPGLGDFVSYVMILSAKLAGALGGLARGWVFDSGLTIASLKRALAILHQAITAADSLDSETPFPAARIAHFRSELWAIREQIIALMASLRSS